MVTYAESDNVLHEEKPGHIRLNILLSDFIENWHFVNQFDSSTRGDQ